jgi:outer membrane protein assembly factor BamB
MKIKHVVLSVMTLAICAVTDAQDWPQFRGVNRDSRVTGFEAPASWPAELQQGWKVNVGTGDATPVLVKDRLFLHTRQGADEVVLCLNASTGREIWKNQYSSPAVTGPAGSHPGPRSTPAVVDGKVITYGAAGILSCLDAATGKVLWKKDNPAGSVPQFFTGMSPLIAGSGVCVVHTGTKDNGEVVAIDMKTGNEKWKWAGDGPAYASPSLMTAGGKTSLIVQTEKNLIAFDLSDGKILWQMATPVQQRFYNCVSPYIDGNTIYVTGQGSGMKAVKTSGTATQDLWTNAEINCLARQ